MKKLVKLSLAASMMLTGSLYADTIAEAFADGKISGELKSQYFQKEVSDQKVGIWTNGGNLSFVTGSFYGLKAGVTFQAATVTNKDVSNSTTAYDADQNVSGAVASEAYLEYTRGNTTGKIGRQYITTPLVAGSGSRIFKQSFEAYLLTNTDLADTTLVAGYVSRFQGRTGSNNGAPSFTRTVPAVNFGTVVLDGAYTVYAKNTSVENLTLSAQYAYVGIQSANSAKALYADASYNLAPITISAQTYQTDSGATTNSNGSAYGIKMATSIDKLSLSAAYSSVDNESDIVNGLGSGADYLYTGSWIYGGIYAKDTNAYKLAGGYSFTNDLSFDLAYASWKTGTAERASETDYVLNYNFDKNLSAKLVVATYDKLSTESYRSRLYVSYKF